MSDKPSAPPAEAPKGAVIRRLEAAHETAQERLMKKHLPAWVISGAVNVGIIALVMLLTPDRGANARPPEQAVVATDEKPPATVEENLVQEDRGLQADLDSALPDQERIDRATVDAAQTDDNLGRPDALDLDKMALPVPGLPTSADGASGVPGDTGKVMSGETGFGGTMFATFAGRGGSTKSKLIKEGGGNAESERAVAMGLAWLARQQKPDGSWVYDGDNKGEVIAATGMALLPFLAAGETHKTGTKYQKTVTAGLNFLLRNCPISGPNQGKFTGSGTMYAQGIGALALCEAYGMTKDKGMLLAGAQASINFIQRQQGVNGSWGYSVTAPSTGDTSIVGWQVQALQAARLSKDIVVDPKVWKKAIEFLEFAGGGSRKASYGYANSNGAAPGTSLTAVGLLCRYYTGWEPTNAGYVEGVIGLMGRAPAGTTKKPRATKPALDMYYYYYATQVVHFFEGDDWKDWNEGPKAADNTRKGGMRDWLVSLQNKQDGANQGSWAPESGFIGGQCGRVGTTSLCLLTLEVYYRHLPLYKRGQNADALKIVEGRP
jgi:hypothetical protein